jgi:hypothetical protein
MGSFPAHRDWRNDAEPASSPALIRDMATSSAPLTSHFPRGALRPTGFRYTQGESVRERGAKSQGTLPARACRRARRVVIELLEHRQWAAFSGLVPAPAHALFQTWILSWQPRASRQHRTSIHGMTRAFRYLVAITSVLVPCVMTIPSAWSPAQHRQERLAAGNGVGVRLPWTAKVTAACRLATLAMISSSDNPPFAMFAHSRE